MAFTIGQMLGGWRKKGGSKKAPRSEGELRSKHARTSESPKRGLSASTMNEAIKTVPKSAVMKGESDLAWELIVAPHISEKATMQGENRYTFKVSGKATKGTLKRAIEERYKVDVESLNMLNMPSKKRRRGAVIGIKSGFKKAVVGLKKGQTINEF